MKFRDLVLASLVLATSATTALAREPCVGSIVPPGATLGVLIGANPPPGLFFSSRSTLSFGQLKDATGNDAGVDLNVKATVLQLHYTPKVTLLGRDYRAMALVPRVYLDQTTGASFPPFLHGKSNVAGHGIGFSKPMPRAELNPNLLDDVLAKETVGGTAMLINFSMPVDDET